MTCHICWVKLTLAEVAAGYADRLGVLCEDCWCGWRGTDEEHLSIAECHGNRTEETPIYKELCVRKGPPLYRWWGDGRLQASQTRNFWGKSYGSGHRGG